MKLSRRSRLYGTFLFFLRQKDMNLEMFVNYRQLNHIMIADLCPGPEIERNFEDLREHRHFAAIDMYNRY